MLLSIPAAQGILSRHQAYALASAFGGTNMTSPHSPFVSCSIFTITCATLISLIISHVQHSYRYATHVAAFGKCERTLPMIELEDPALTSSDHVAEGVARR